MLLTNTPHHSRRKWFGFAFVALLGLLLVSIPAHAQGGGTLRVGTDAPKVLDPAKGSNDPEIALNRAIYDYLLELEPDNTVGPNLAKSWKISDDGLTYTFTLESGVAFQDGSPFSSKDVVFTFKRLKDVGSPANVLLGDFDVTAPDDSTVVFALKKPNADFLYGVASQFALILKDGTQNPNVIAEGDKPYANFNGTGPFMLKEYKEGQDAILVKNPNYWKKGEPLLDELDFTYFSGDATTQINALVSGQVDLIFKVPVGQLPAVQGKDGISVIEQKTSQHGVIRLRTDEGPGKDVKVRQAFKYATDRDQLNQLLLSGLGTVGNNDPIAPVFSEFYDNTIQNQTYDPKKACDLLAQAGYPAPDGLKMTLYAPQAFEYADLAAALQNQWKQGCINVDIQVLDAGQYYDTTTANNWCSVDLGITGWGSRPTPQLFLVQAYSSAAIDPLDKICTNGYNESRWSNKDLDDLIAQAGVTADTAKRKEIYSKISQIFLDQGPIIIPYFAPLIGVVSNKVKGLELAPFPGLTDYRNVSVEG
jgi:peptide/nickel transport system substrate-binding protein